MNPATQVSELDSKFRVTVRNRRKRRLKIVSANVRGLVSGTKQESLLDSLSSRNIFAAAVQETWEIGSNELTHTLSGYSLISVGEKVKSCSRGSKGVGIALSRHAMRAYRDAEGQGKALFTGLGPRVMGMRMLVKNMKGRNQGIFMVSAYAPTSKHGDGAYESFLTSLEACLKCRQTGDMVVLCGDFNASITGGLSRKGRGMQAIGEFTGSVPTSRSGDRFKQWLLDNRLCSMASFYKKKGYATWVHPGHHNTQLQYDHIIVEQGTRQGGVVQDCGRCQQFVQSDHFPVVAKLCLKVKYKKKLPKTARAQAVSKDFGQLQEGGDPALVDENEEFRLWFVHGVTAKYDSLTQVGRMQEAFDLGLSIDGPGSIGGPKSIDGSIGCGATQLERAVVLQEEQQEEQEDCEVKWESKFAHLDGALAEMQREMLPKRPKWSKPWFEKNAVQLRKVLTKTHVAFAEFAADKSEDTRAKLKAARKSQKRAIAQAKSDWILCECGVVGNLTEVVDDKFVSSKAAWRAVMNLKAGLDSAIKSGCGGAKLRKFGSKTEFCKNEEEEAEARGKHFANLLERKATYQDGIEEDLEQHEVCVQLDDDLTEQEVDEAVRKLNSSGPGMSGAHALSMKVLWKSSEGSDIIFDLVTCLWRDEEIPDHWVKALLKILDKAGDQTDPSNCRGIQMLEVSYKIIGNIMRKRSRVISETLDHEAQTGFRFNRGTCDGLWNVCMSLAKRREHGLETWVLLLDLVKAFDRVPRELLWKVMVKFGYPPKYMRVLKKLHTGVEVHFSMGGIDKVVKSTIGVKQGDLFGPDLFNVHIAAVMIIWRKRWSETKPPRCTFRTRQDFTLGSGATGDTRRWEAGGKTGRCKGVEEFDVVDSEYADDTAVLFTSRAELEKWTPSIVQTFKDMGMEVHIKQPGDKKEAKTVAMYMAVPGSTGADLTEVKLPGGGLIPIVEKAKYLGAMIHRDGSSKCDVEARINKAASAFGILVPLVFSNSDITKTAKRAVYVSIVVAILLYGSEVWALTDSLRRKLRTFHNRCVRRICGVSMYRVKDEKITTEDILERADIRCITIYMTRRRLRWIGHVSRMDWERVPRKLLSSWVYHKRPRGRPHMRWAESIRKDLETAGLTMATWSDLAKNKTKWKSRTRYVGEPTKKKTKTKTKKKTKKTK